MHEEFKAQMAELPPLLGDGWSLSEMDAISNYGFARARFAGPDEANLEAPDGQD